MDMHLRLRRAGSLTVLITLAVAVVGCSGTVWRSASTPYPQSLAYRSRPVDETAGPDRRAIGNVHISVRLDSLANDILERWLSGSLDVLQSGTRRMPPPMPPPRMQRMPPPRDLDMKPTGDLLDTLLAAVIAALAVGIAATQI